MDQGTWFACSVTVPQIIRAGSGLNKDWIKTKSHTTQHYKTIIVWMCMNINFPNEIMRHTGRTGKENGQDDLDLAYNVCIKIYI